MLTIRMYSLHCSILCLISGKTMLTDKQFDRLREDLSWEVRLFHLIMILRIPNLTNLLQGSALVTLNRNETLFLNAMQAYAKNQPIMSDQQFDELKQSLRDQGSKIAVASEPKCYVDTGVCKVTWSPDTIRTSSLYLPAALLLGILYIGIVSSVVVYSSYLILFAPRLTRFHSSAAMLIRSSCSLWVGTRSSEVRRKLPRSFCSKSHSWREDRARTAAWTTVCSLAMCSW